MLHMAPGCVPSQRSPGVSRCATGRQRMSGIPCFLPIPETLSAELVSVSPWDEPTQPETLSAELASVFPLDEPPPTEADRKKPRCIRRLNVCPLDEASTT